MSKAVMLSIQPRHCKNISTVVGEENEKPVYKKTVEIRKTAPKLETPFKCYIYCTKNNSYMYRVRLDENRLAIPEVWNGRVIGEFVCDRIETYIADDLVGAKTSYGEITKPIEGEFAYWVPNQERLCLTYSEIRKYGNGKPLYGWHISDLKIYDKPKELSEFKRDCGQYGSDNPLCDDCKYYICCKGLDFDESDCAVNGYIPITRPPQSWGYVEEI